MESLSFRALLVLRALCREHSRAPESFFGLEDIEALLPRMRRESLSLSMAELTAAGYVNACFGDDEAQLYILTTSGRAAGRGLARLAGQALLSLLKTVLPWTR